MSMQLGPTPDDDGLWLKAILKTGPQPGRGFGGRWCLTYVVEVMHEGLPLCELEYGIEVARGDQPAPHHEAQVIAKAGRHLCQVAESFDDCWRRMMGVKPKVVLVAADHLSNNYMIPDRRPIGQGPLGRNPWWDMIPPHLMVG